MDFETVRRAKVEVEVEVEVFEYDWRKADGAPAWDWRVRLAGGGDVTSDGYFETEVGAIADAERALGL